MQFNLNNIYSKIILGGCFALLAMKSNSQPIAEPRKVEVTYNKTSSIVFPAIIKSVDRGSRDILAQKAKGVNNVLQLKAGKPNFAETNLTVITGDGILHQFTLNYSDKPASLSINLSEDSLQNKMPLIFQTEMTETEMENYSTGIVQTKRTVRSISENKYKISIALLSIYIKDDVMFYRFKIRNRSNINYTIDFLKFYIRDQTKIKRTASQEVVIKPIYVFGNDKEVKGKSETDIVYALEKFTIPESKHLDVEMFEHNGGRHFNLIIKNKTIVNARLLP